MAVNHLTRVVARSSSGDRLAFGLPAVFWING